MRILAFASILWMSISVFGATVSVLPQSEYADTEVSTNIAFVVERPAMTRIEFTVALDATQTNNVEVAIGTDANGDGNLAVEEAAYVFGYDCGKWFERNREGAGSIGTECPTLSARIEKSFVLKRRQLDTAWDMVKVTRRGCGATCELVKAEGKLPGFKLEMR